MPKGIKGFQKGHPQYNTGRTHLKKGKNNPNWKGGISLDKKKYSREHRRKIRRENPEKLRKQWEEYYKKNRKRLLAQKKEYYKSPAGIYTRLSKEAKISKQDFIKWYNTQERKCYYCEIPEELISQLEGFNIGSKVVKRLTIDRLDNKQGYDKGNIVLACIRCNQIKSNFFTTKEMKEIAEKYIKPKWISRDY